MFGVPVANTFFKTDIEKRFMTYSFEESALLTLNPSAFDVLKRARFTRPY